MVLKRLRRRYRRLLFRFLLIMPPLCLIGIVGGGGSFGESNGLMMLLASYILWGLPALLTGAIIWWLRLRRNLGGMLMATAIGVLTNAAFLFLLGANARETKQVLLIGGAVAFCLSFRLPGPRKFQLPAADGREIYYRRLIAAFITFGPLFALLPPLLYARYVEDWDFNFDLPYLPATWLLPMALTALVLTRRQLRRTPRALLTATALGAGATVLMSLLTLYVLHRWGSALPLFAGLAVEVGTPWPLNLEFFTDLMIKTGCGAVGAFCMSLALPGADREKIGEKNEAP